MVLINALQVLPVNIQLYLKKFNSLPAGPGCHKDTKARMGTKFIALCAYLGLCVFVAGYFNVEDPGYFESKSTS